MIFVCTYLFCLSTESRRKPEREKTDEEKAREAIKKAKVEDDEYKTEEQTYYRYLNYTLLLLS